MSRDAAVQLALTPDSRWDISTPALLDAARGAGYSAVGLPAARATAEVAAAYRAGGLRCHEVMALVVGEDQSATISSAERLAEAASVVGAAWVLTVFRSDPAHGLASTIRTCAAIFARAGARMAVEFSPLGPVGSMAAGLEVVAMAGAERAGVVIDSWHFCCADPGWDELSCVPLECVAYVQFSDGLPPETDNRMRETLDRRALPGQGVFDLRRFVATLRDRGWRGLVSVEVLSEEMRRLPVPEFARLAYAATASYWT